jgi:excisionase family DNA binding protein
MAKREKKSAPIVDRLLTLEEAAERLGFSSRTVRKFAQRGELEGRLISGRWRFRPESLSAFYENAPRNWDFD